MEINWEMKYFDSGTANSIIKRVLEEPSYFFNG